MFSLCLGYIHKRLGSSEEFFYRDWLGRDILQLESVGICSETFLSSPGNSPWASIDRHCCILNFQMFKLSSNSCSSCLAFRVYEGRRPWLLSAGWGNVGLTVSPRAEQSPLGVRGEEKNVRPSVPFSKGLPVFWATWERYWKRYNQKHHDCM